jgi:hypothetical protein
LYLAILGSPIPTKPTKKKSKLYFWGEELD